MAPLIMFSADTLLKSERRQDGATGDQHRRHRDVEGEEEQYPGTTRSFDGLHLSLVDPPLQTAHDAQVMLCTTRMQMMVMRNQTCRVHGVAWDPVTGAGTPALSAISRSSPSIRKTSTV